MMTIDIPDDLVRPLQEAAAGARMDLSEYLTDLLHRELRPVRLPDNFDDLYGSWRGTFDEIKDPPPDDPSSNR